MSIEEGGETWERQREHIDSNPDFHLDPNKATDTAEKLIERHEGPVGALKELAEQLELNPTDAEIIRQIKFVANRLKPSH